MNRLSFVEVVLDTAMIMGIWDNAIIELECMGQSMGKMATRELFHDAFAPISSTEYVHILMTDNDIQFCMN